MTGTCVQSFGGHDEQIRLLKRHRIGLGLPELTGKDADPMPTKASAPALEKLVCEGAKRRQVDRPLALVENLRDGLLGQPRLAAPGGQLEDDAEPAPQKTLVVNLPLRRIQFGRRSFGCDLFGWNFYSPLHAVYHARYYAIVQPIA